MGRLPGLFYICLCTFVYNDSRQFIYFTCLLTYTSFTEPLRFTEVPSQTVIDEGTHHVLLCAAEALPAPEITWFWVSYNYVFSQTLL